MRVAFITQCLLFLFEWSLPAVGSRRYKISVTTNTDNNGFGPSMVTSVPVPETMRDTIYAANPFDHPKADVILRSSDNVYFRVFKLFLSLASPFFETLFEIPQPTETSGEQEIKDGLAVIPVTEDSKTLDHLLRFCYPCTLTDDPKLEVFKDIVDVLEAARKYSLDVIQKKATKAVSNPEVLKSDPMSCFAVACRGRLRAEAQLAAKHTLTQPLIPLWFKEIDLISAAELLALLTYHQTCGGAIRKLSTDSSWIVAHYSRTVPYKWLMRESGCKCPRTQSIGGFGSVDRGPQWWDTFMGRTFEALREKPCRATIESVAEETVRLVRGRDCSTCSANVSEGVREFSNMLAMKVEEVISHIKLKLRF